MPPFCNATYLPAAYVAVWYAVALSVVVAAAANPGALYVILGSIV